MPDRSSLRAIQELLSNVEMVVREHIAACFDPPSVDSLLAGAGPADVHNRAPRDLPMVTSGAQVVGNGVLARQDSSNVIFCQLAPHRVSRAAGLAPSLTICDRKAYDGERSALVTMGTTPWARFGQKVSAGQVGKTYTLAVSVKNVGDPVTLRLEIESAGPRGDQMVRGEDTPVQTETWHELHVSFQVDKPSGESWHAFLHCGQEGARFRADLFRLYEGPYAPERCGAGDEMGQARRNMLINSSFESGTEPWYFPWPTEQQNLRRTYRRWSFLVNRLLANRGVAAATPLLSRFATPSSGATGESLLRNGDFRHSPRGDELDHCQIVADSRQVAWQREPGDADFRGQILKITSREPVSESDGRERGSVMLAQHDVPVQADQWYRIQLRAKAEELDADGVTLAVQDTQSWQSLIDYQRFLPQATWEEFSFVVQAKATAPSQTRFQIWHGSTGTLWLGDVSMTPCDPPSQGRWTRGLYADQPQEWDDPYRIFRW